MMADRIRLLQLMMTFDIEGDGGGVSRFVVELAKKLDNFKFEVILCSLGKFDAVQTSQERIKYLNEQGIQAFSATRWVNAEPYQSFLRAHQAMSAFAEQNRIDIVHSHSLFTDINAAMLKLQRKTHKIIRTVHYGYRYEWRNRWLLRTLFTNFLYPITYDQEIGINQQNTDRLNQRWAAKILSRRATRIYNAIPLEKFGQVKFDTKHLKHDLGIPPNAPVIGSVGRLEVQKGFSYLFKAAPTVLEQIPNVYFIIIGDGPQANELKEEANRTQAGHRIIFTGPRTDVEALLNCMDLFVSSSLWEGLPTVVLEAMACGTPVVATDIPGTNELVQDHVNGWLAQPADSKNLASVMIEAMSEVSLRKSITTNALNTVNKFSMESIASEYANVYENLVN